MMVAGIGCRAGASSHDIEAALAAACARGQLDPNRLRVIATPSAKGGEPGVCAVASARGARLVLVTQAELKAADARAATRSERVLALTGVSSVAEAAALAVAGPHARLVVPKVVVGAATCAIAMAGDAP